MSLIFYLYVRLFHPVFLYLSLPSLPLKIIPEALQSFRRTALVMRSKLANTDLVLRFYYADERKPDGSPAFRDVDGDAHAEMYVSLAEGDEQGPWQQTFVKGVGYKKFPLAAE